MNQSTTQRHQKKKTEEQRHERRSEHGRYIKSIVYGGLDGTITTFVVVAGAAGASLPTGILLIFGLGSLLGDALSMAIGDYASSYSEREYYQAERHHHTTLFEQDPEAEKRKLEAEYQEKGLSKEEAETIVSILAKNKHTIVEVMMLNEHGLVEANTSPVAKGIYTFFSFISFGSMPLLTYIIAPHISLIRAHTFLTASILTGVTLFTLGALKVRITERNWFVSGSQMLLTGGASAVMAYLIGYFLAGIV